MLLMMGPSPQFININAIFNYLTTSIDPAPDLKKSVDSSTSTFKIPFHIPYNK